MANSEGRCKSEEPTMSREPRPRTPSPRPPTSPNALQRTCDVPECPISESGFRLTEVAELNADGTNYIRVTRTPQDMNVNTPATPGAAQPPFAAFRFSITRGSQYQEYEVADPINQ
jgi:hypothetical protein